MSITADNAFAGLPKEASAEQNQRKYFIGPVVDFLCLGGASLIVLPLMALLLPVEPVKPTLAAIMMALANLINHPHFAHSYQIFYSDFRRKAFSGQTDPVLRMRYIFAGIVVPLLLLLFFAVSLGLGDIIMLGLGMNLMLFLVGWHYIKQGYGMAIVDSVFKRLFFSDGTKKCMLINGYACWILSWMIANREFAAQDYWGVAYYTFDIPDLAFYAAASFACATSLATIFALAKSWRSHGGKIAVNGVMAYLTTLYLWVVFVKVNPLFILVVPAFHSLQYLLVVWRFQMNREQDRPDAGDIPEKKWLGHLTPSNATLRFTLFLASGVGLGFLAFWLIPFVFSGHSNLNPEIFGGTVFFFVCWIFVNVHHYFLDNVMWRRENPDTKKYLFA